MHWVEMIPLVLWGGALVFVPGFFIGWVLRLPLHRRLLDAPLLSVACLSVAAIVAGLLKLQWGVLTYAALAAVFILGAWAVSFFFGRKGNAGQPAPRRSILFGLVGAGLGAIILCLQLKAMIGDPLAISQSYDNIFHLNAIRYIADTGDGSSLTLNSMSLGTQGQFAFYPAAWHDLTSVIFELFPASIPAATNATTFVVAAFIWPLGMVNLALALRPSSPILVGATGVLSAAFLSFPGLMLKWGILYPNLLGYALLPSFLVVLREGAKAVAGERVRHPLTLTIQILVGTAAIVLAHPNALTSAAVFIAPLIVLEGWTLIRKPGAVPRVRVTLLSLGLLLCIAIWWFVRPAADTATWGPKESAGQALGEFLMNSFNVNPIQFSVSALVFVGIAVLIRRRQGLWLLLCWAVAGCLWTVGAGFSVSSLRSLLTGPWYNDSFRLAALTAIPSVLLAASGFAALVERVRRLAEERGKGRISARSIGVAVTAVAAIVVVMICAEPSHRAATASVAKEFALTKDSLLLTADEKAVLDEIDRFVPQDDVIIVNPWEGSAVAYALEDREVTSRHSLSLPREEYVPITSNLIDADTDPAVCEAVHATRAYWLLDFEDTLDIGKSQAGEYAGLRGVESTDVVEPVFTSGDAGLYRVTACD